MDTLLNKEKPEVRLRAFRAIDDPEACRLFLQGHERVLTNIGVKKVTSSNDAWMHNPSSFVLIVESLDRSRVYGGARVHVANGIVPLPVEEATSPFDARIFDHVYGYALRGTGEVCGLWNSREIAGYGIGSIFLFRAAVAISTQIGLNSLFGLCAPYTLKMAQNVGFEVLEAVGNHGTFYYPKLDLLATAVYMTDIHTLKNTAEEDKEAILKLRENLQIVITEELRNKQMTIHYDIAIPNLEAWSITNVTANLKMNFEPAKVDEKNISFL
jgi:hypothetical protein